MIKGNNAVNIKRLTLLLAVCLYAIFIIIRLYLYTLPSSTSSTPLHIIVAFESIPYGLDGGERYLAALVRVISELVKPNVQITFVSRSSSGRCKARRVDSIELEMSASIVETLPESAVFARLLSTPRSVLLLPLVFLDSCGGNGVNSSAEDYATAAQSLCERYDDPVCVPIGVFAFEAQAARLEGFAIQEPNAAQSKRYDAAARIARIREERLYGKADVFAMLTPQDIAIAPSTRIGVPRLVVHFRDAVDSRLTLLGSGGASTHERSAMVSATLLPWKVRNGFFFLGGGDSPSNHISLHAFLVTSWPRILEAIPSAKLHIVGSPPTRLCKEHGLWCGWLAHTPFFHSHENIILHGRIDDVEPIMNTMRVAISPLICGTGVNTKTGFSLARGLPVVATEKGARGYTVESNDNNETKKSDGLLITLSLESLSDAAVSLHENETAWTAASIAALELTARLDDSRALAGDIKAMIVALETALRHKIQNAY
jgi:hypothetical protein